MPGTTCLSLQGLSLETTAGLLLCSGRARGLHGSSSLLPGSPSGLRGPDPASSEPGAAGGEGASPQGTLLAPTPLVQQRCEAWALQRGCVRSQPVRKTKDAANILLLVFVATSRSPSILIFVLEGTKSSSFLPCFTHHSSLQTFPVSLLHQLRPG